MSKNPIKNIFNKIKFKKIGFSRFDLKLLGILLVIQLLLAGLTFYKSSYQFNYSYLKNYYIQFISVYLALSVLLFFTYRDYVKRNISFSLYFVYLVITVLMGLNIIGLNSLVETLSSRDMFSVSNYLFVTFFLILALSLISRYDFPVTTNFKEFYLESMSHFRRNLGIFIAICLVTAVLGFYVKTWVYSVSFFLIIDSIYFAKAVLANVRR